MSQELAPWIKGKKVFITGGAGFIGEKLSSVLCLDNDVTVYDKAQNLPTRGNIRFVSGDILDFQKLLESSADHNVFVHAAAVAGIYKTSLSPSNTLRTNVIGTFNSLESARLHGSYDKFVYISTSEVLGINNYKSEETDDAKVKQDGDPRWCYAVGKLTGEHLTQSYSKEYNMPSVILRPFNIYGPGQIGEGAINMMVRKALAGEDLFVFGDGLQIRAWCYVDDMVQGILKSIHFSGRDSEIFHIGNPITATTNIGLAERIVRILGSNSKIVHLPPIASDVDLRIPSIDKAKKYLDFSPKVGLEEGLRQTAEWYSQMKDVLPEIPDFFISKK
jgi:UDP-glucose 4-epimerase